jgi:hypothetical protein
MSSIIPAKDVAGVFLKEIQDFVRKEYPNATEDEICELEWKFALGTFGGMFGSAMK